ncbi:hypothetical protein NFI95_13305 [Acetobacteraceae bacterium KSS8]|uniref:Uncharacterized protein n=1 Tax=Endosaccharibacter trunci TaxID=2812733 RepID=A0ABT1W948_9PROT|nr:hypothetical protein [Acetobacteraceae bacterium KSS8]
MTDGKAGTIVIVAYRPKPGCDAALVALAREHLPILRERGLATDRPEVLMRAADGTIVEVFEWAPGAIERAHADVAVQALWARYAAVCDYVPLNTLAETSELFAGFTPLPECSADSG